MWRKSSQNKREGIQGWGGGWASKPVFVNCETRERRGGWRGTWENTRHAGYRETFATPAPLPPHRFRRGALTRRRYAPTGVSRERRHEPPQNGGRLRRMAELGAPKWPPRARARASARGTFLGHPSSHLSPDKKAYTMKSQMHFAT